MVRHYKIRHTFPWNPWLSNHMGIYDRDYMRRNERKPADTPRDIARKGIVFAGCSVVGVLLIAGMIRRHAAQQEAENRALRSMDDQFRSILQQTPEPVRETPPMLRRLVHVNPAEVDELQSVPYVGPSLAAPIISHRPYASLDELDKAPGIGKRKIEMLRPYLTVK